MSHFTSKFLAPGLPEVPAEAEKPLGWVGGERERERFFCGRGAASLARLPLQPRAGLAALLLGGGAQLADQLVDAACVLLDAVELVQL